MSVAPPTLGDRPSSRAQMMSGATRRWRVQEPGDAAVRGLVQELALSPFAATVLANRGLSAPDEAAGFLDPRLRDIPSPFLMKGVPEAVERILRAFRDDEPIAVWGDYDVDGVTSVAQLLVFFRELGVRAPRYVIPDRFRDGYGLNLRQMAELAELGVKLVITVDCGISAVPEIRRAVELGLDVIVVDHHKLGEDLPPAAAIINPLQDDCAFPFSSMAACGLVFFLLVALRKALRERGVFDHLPEPDLRSYLDLVGLGTIADMVPLMAQNRLFARRGLDQLDRSERPGIVALRKVANLGERSVDGTVVGFEIAPRLNAAGRLGSARRAVDLLTSVSLDEALPLAQEVDRENLRRREVQKAAFQDAVRLIEADAECSEDRVLVLADEAWHPGVVGIVASKLVDRYHRPVVLIALRDGLGRGSGRSVAGVDLFAALSACAEHLEAYGGHALAGGVTVRAENLDAFRAAFRHAVGAALADDPAPAEIAIDGVVSLENVDRSLLAEIERLGPFGAGYPAPTFLAQAVRVASVRVVGRDHLQFQLRDGRAQRPAIAFGQAHRKPEPGSLIDVVFRPEMEFFRGRQTLRLRIEDFRPHPG